MKVIFLDIDGVMVTKNCKERSERYRFLLFDPESVKRLKQILDATDANIVVSSTWRRSKDITWILKENGLRMFSKTPHLDGKIVNGFMKSVERGREIQKWLDTHWGIESFVILDDDDDMGDLLPYLVQTSWWTGITDEHVQKAIQILNGGVDCGTD